MTTKQALQKEFMKQYCQKNYNQITVKSLCAGTPAARTTFYSYYQNIDELMNDVENIIIDGILDITNETSKNHISDMDFSTFLVVQPNVRFIQKWKEAIKKHFSLRFPNKCGAVNFELISETIAAAMIGAYS